MNRSSTSRGMFPLFLGARARGAAGVAVVLIAALQVGSGARTQPQGPEWAAFGYGLALGPDTLFVAASAQARAPRVGTVQVFTRTAGKWSLNQVLPVPAATIEDPFGVSLSVDRDTLVVGAPFADDRGDDAGLAYVFERRDGRWQPAGRLLADDGSPGDQFGLTVAASGETLAIGARLADTRGRDAGAAYVFARHGGRWEQVQKLVASDAAAGDLFGRVSLDQDFLLVSADLNDDRGPNAGKAYGFTRRGDRWVETARVLVDDGVAGDEFGVSLALDGGIAVFGAVGAAVDAQRSGAAYAFDVREGRLALAARLTPGAPQTGQAFAMAVAADAGTLVVGAPDTGRGRPGLGAAHVFERRDGTWTETAKLTAAAANPHSAFGSTVALSGNTLAVGVLLRGDRGEAGAVHVFERREAVWSEVARLTPR